MVSPIPPLGMLSGANCRGTFLGRYLEQSRARPGNNLSVIELVRDLCYPELWRHTLGMYVRCRASLFLMNTHFFAHYQYI